MISSEKPVTFQDFRPLPAAIDIGGVEEINAGVDRRIHDVEAGRFVGDVAEVHRPERQPADLKAGPAKMGVFHG